MQYRTLGGGLSVSSIGLGCMPMTGLADQGFTYGVVDVKEAVATLADAVDLGITFFDTADYYGFHANECFVGDHLDHHRKRLVIATKFGFTLDGQGKITGIDCSPKRARAACEGSLRRLKVEAIDLYYQHRIDPTIPVEESIGGMADLVAEGKVKQLGLCAVTPDTLRKAHATHPIAAVQSEYSLWERGVEQALLPALAELGIGFVPYSPLGRGFLAGNIASPAALTDGDHRRNDPRFDLDSFAANMAIVDGIKVLGAEINASTAQVALAWLLSRGGQVVPIPGSKRRVTLRDSARAADIVLTPDMLARLDALAPPGVAAGARVRVETQELLANR